MGGRKSSIFLGVCMRVLIISLEILLCTVVPSICCLQFVFAGRASIISSCQFCFVFCLFERMRATRVATKQALPLTIWKSSHCSPFIGPQSAWVFPTPCFWGQELMLLRNRLLGFYVQATCLFHIHGFLLWKNKEVTAKTAPTITTKSAEWQSVP